MNHKLTFAAMALVGLLVSVGCSSFPKSSKPTEVPLLSADEGKKGKEKEIEYGDPEKMAVIWTDSAATLPGKPTTRGFGGRFFFYDEEGETVPVDGELSIYGFDDSDDSQQRKVADRKYIFRASELQGHASKNDLGLSYSFWVPWDAVGGYRTTVSLLPVFKTADGKVVRGEMSVNVLPGKAPEMAEDNLTAGMKVPYANPHEFGNRQVGYQERVDRGFPTTEDSSLNRTQMKISTIGVPRDLGNQMQAPQAARQRPAPAPSEPETPVTRLEIEQKSVPDGKTQVGTGPAPGFHRQGFQREDRPRRTLNTGTGR